MWWMENRYWERQIPGLVISLLLGLILWLAGGM